MIMFEAMAHFLIHEEIANTEGQCCIILMPDFILFCFVIFFFFTFAIQLLWKTIL